MVENKGVARDISDKLREIGVKISANMEFKSTGNNIQRGVLQGQEI